MIPGPSDSWTDAGHDIVTRLVKQFLSRPESDSEELVAVQATGAIPVYKDIGGCVLLTPDGSLMEWDWERKTVQPLVDRQMRDLAFVSAAERYPELTWLRPMRNGPPCPVCKGGGRVAEGAWCGNCSGVGRL